MQNNFELRDPYLYLKLSEPQASNEDATSNLDQFCAEMQELRKKYKIPNVVILACVNYLDDNVVKQTLHTMSCGDSDMVFPMLVAALKAEHKKLQVEDQAQQKEEDGSV